jgi:hypothetical protein
VFERKRSMNSLKDELFATIHIHFLSETILHQILLIFQPNFRLPAISNFKLFFFFSFTNGLIWFEVQLWYQVVLTLSQSQYPCYVFNCFNNYNNNKWNKMNNTWFKDFVLEVGFTMLVIHGWSLQFRNFIIEVVKVKIWDFEGVAYWRRWDLFLFFSLLLVI